MTARTTPTSTGRRARSTRSAAALAGTAVALVALGIATILGPSAAAADDSTSSGPRVVVDRIDARGSTVRMDGFVLGADPAQIEVSSAGKAVVATVVPAAPSDVVVVLDNAASLGNAAVQLSKQAVAAMGEAVSPIAVVTTGGGAEVVTGSAKGAAEVAAALDSVGPDGASSTWQGVVTAAELLEGRSAGRDATVVLVTSTPDLSTSSNSSAARAALQRVGARMDVVALPMGADLDSVAAIVRDSGGTVTVVDADEKLAPALTTVAEQLDGRFSLELPASEDELVPLTVSVGEQSLNVGYVSGSLNVGESGLIPVAASGSSPFAASPVKWLVVLLGLVAGFMLVWSVATMVVPDRDGVVQRLQAYEEAGLVTNIENDPFAQVDQSHASIPLITRAVELTGELAERRGVLEKVEVMLERASLPLRAPEAMFFTAALGALAVALAYFGTGSVVLALIVAVLAVMVPPAVLNMRIAQRKKAFLAQLPDTLTLLASTLKAGYSIGQGFEAISREVADPMAKELQRVVTEARLGRPLEEALEAMADRMDSEDFAWAVMAIRIQREVGGNLAELLLTVADTMTQRERLRREVKTLTAEGRMSAMVIGFLPPALAGVLYVMNREYVSVLFTDGRGQMLVGLAVVMMIIGFFWMKKTITIEV